jgi:hypothetical protein
MKTGNLLGRARIAAFGLMGLMLATGGLATAQSESAVIATYTLPDIALADAQAMALPAYPIADDRGILLGGIGSDMWRAEGDPADEFWMVTDRGPNGQIEVEGSNRRTFPVPDFTPHILQVRISGESIEILQAIAIVGQSGAPVTGISNIDGHDEKPWDATAQTELAYNPNGLDTEGLVRAPDGTFWLSEEYGTSILHVDATGKVVKRLVPQGLALTGTDYEVIDSLPSVYSMRKRNRGFEGLAISRDGSTLYATLQSPLSNPDRDTGEASRNTRVLAIDSTTGQPVAEYVYQFEIAAEFDADPEVVQDDMKVSGIIALDGDTMLILERTDAVAKVYIVEAANATNILGSAWDDPATSPTLEATADLAAAGVTPLAKTLLVDLDALEGMPDKIEGMALIDGTTIAVANDNDFDIGEIGADGKNVGEGKKSQILVVRVAAVPGMDASMEASPVASPEMDSEAMPEATPVS